MSESKKTHTSNQDGVMGRFLCWMDFHKWEQKESDSILEPIMHVCKRCKVREFSTWVGKIRMPPK
jgi:hypothetical protein